jgi:flavodoxin
MCLTIISLCFLIIVCNSCQTSVDTVTGATTTMSNPQEGVYNTNSKILIILFSMENNNTAKIANAIANVLDADVKSPQQIDPNDIKKYDLVGFGSGIFDGKHHVSISEFVGTLSFSPNTKVFIFSTSGISRESLSERDDPHKPLREKLLSKGFIIIGEFNCVGFNDNSFLKLFGGMNKGRPNAGDIKQAEEFARKLINYK